MPVIIYDTTLRDGTQGEGVQLSVGDKLAITKLLDELGVGYIEGGWPGSNPRDELFFEEARKLELAHARLTAFGATRRAGVACDEDPSLQALLRSEVPVVTIFGKSWKFQATHALRIDPDKNLELIEDTVRYLKRHVDEVIFDAEHFFDGYADDPAYALAALKAAEQGGADYLVLCDTNGGTLPHVLAEAVRDAIQHAEIRVGIHTHNDSELAVANSLEAVRAGAGMVQGTLNGYGERCGNANLVSIIPALALKMGIECLPQEGLQQLTKVAHTVDELANRVPWRAQPYVGRSAFAHKGGVHVDAVKKDSRTYEHIDPESVGNQRRILVSDLSGKANILLKAEEYGVELRPDAPQTRAILDQLKRLENQGYQFEGAEASFRLVADEALGLRPKYFQLHDLHVHIQVGDEAELEAGLTAEGHTPSSQTTATLELDVGGERAVASATGEGPVHAMDQALRQLVVKFYPELQTVHLVDYKVRVLDSTEGTGSVVRVLIQSSDGEGSWGTVGVSPNIIEASWRAMADALEYKLVKDRIEPHVGPQIRSIATAAPRGRVTARRRRPTPRAPAAKSRKRQLS